MAGQRVLKGGDRYQEFSGAQWLVAERKLELREEVVKTGSKRGCV